jgi:hypothetical protein
MRSPASRFMVLSLTVLFAGCAIYRGVGKGQEAVSMVAEVAQGWDQRLSASSLRDSIELGRISDEFLRGDPVMLWLVSRELNALAYGHAPDDSEELYTLAYETGFRCLAGNAGWLGRLENSGGAVTVAGVERLTSTDVPCVEQLVLAWVRLIEHRGVYSYIDIPEVVFLLDRLLEISPDRWVGYWGKGMIGGFQASPLGEIEIYMDLAYEQEPTLATATADYLKISGAYAQSDLIVTPAEKFRQREFLVNEGQEWALENQRAVRALFEP